LQSEYSAIRDKLINFKASMAQDYIRFRKENPGEAVAVSDGGRKH
jgi:hypothetical protein